MKIKEVINKILWTVKERKELEKYRLIIIDRVDSTGFREIPFTHIVRVNNNYIYVINIKKEVVAIPLHRVVRIVKGYETIYKRKSNSSNI
ncbi:MAG: RNA repair domain-containing protein [Ignisphaera sp.]|jgi:uncharacterized protein (UPF0248 family)|nr:RNA repair domain-containing protein [Ignisphaera sp.]MCC6056296.1 RNA repair domain-containing protein [Desulfurococcaceae archaeon]